MASIGDEFPEGTKRILAARAGHRCCYSGCRAPTSGPQVDPSGAVNVGVAAHITAASGGGPRYDPTLSRAQRRHPENGIWLCQTHGKLVDNDKTRFTVEEIQKWKGQAEAEASEGIGKPTAPPTADSLLRERWALYNALREIRDQVTASAFPSPSDIAALHTARELSLVLFDESTADYVTEWIHHAVALRSAHRVLSDRFSQEADRESSNEADNQALLFFARQYQELPERLRPYLSSTLRI